MSKDHCCKVDRIRTANNITPPSRVKKDFDSYLISRWLGIDDNDPDGLRTLTEWFNKQVLQTIYRDHGRSDSSIRIDSDYNALRDNDVAEYERVELLSELTEDGIDGEAITKQFIGKSTLSRHLKDCLNASKETPEADTDWEINRIRIATDNYRSHLESALDSLDSKNQIDGVTEAELQIQTYLTCSECPTRVTVETAYEQGYICADHRNE